MEAKLCGGFIQRSHPSRRRKGSWGLAGGRAEWTRMNANRKKPRFAALPNSRPLAFIRGFLPFWLRQAAPCFCVKNLLGFRLRDVARADQWRMAGVSLGDKQPMRPFQVAVRT